MKIAPLAPAIVLPVFNERGNVPLLAAALAVIAGEAIFVDHDSPTAPPTWRGRSRAKTRASA